MTSPLRDPGAVSAVFRTDEWVALDIETSGLSPWQDKTAVVSLYGEKSKTPAVLHVRGGMPASLREWLSDPQRRFVTHNGVGFDILFLANAGVDVDGPEWYDSLIAESALLAAGRHRASVSLRATLQRRLKKEIDKSQQLSTWMAPVLNEEQIAYCADDVQHLPKLRAKQLAQAKKDGKSEALALEHEIIPVVVAMSRNGLPVDRGLLDEYLDSQRDGLVETTAALRRELGLINLDSPIQLRKALGTRGVELASTASNILKELSQLGGTGGHLAQLILNYRYNRQRLKVYSEEWLAKHVQKDGTIKARFWQCGTDTGRFSSTDPNLQQIPRDMRWVFRAPEGYKVISADYSQIEIRVAAALAQDEAMAQALESEDVHGMVASLAFGVPMEELSKEQRTLAKAMSFTWLFCGGVKRFAQNVKLSGGHMSEAEVRQLFERFERRFYRLQYMRQRAFALARRGGSVVLTLPSGLKRQLAGENLKPTSIVNTAVQGGAAAGLKFSMAEIRRRGLHHMLAATVHDELVAVVPSAEAEDYAHELEAAMLAGMERVTQGFVSVKVGLTIGDAWGKRIGQATHNERAQLAA